MTTKFPQLQKKISLNCLEEVQEYMLYDYGPVEFIASRLPSGDWHIAYMLLYAPRRLEKLKEEDITAS